MTEQRIKSVDALRGMALLAILLANLPFEASVAQQGEVDKILEMMFHLLIDKKFITIFSILFGFGFYYQMKKAESGSVNFKKYFIIRMILLFLIGTLHGYILWYGDIIKAYALGAIVLLFLYKMPVNRILYTAVIFNVLLTGIVYIGNNALGWQEYSYDYSLADKLPIVTTYAEYFRINFTINPWTNFPQDMPLTLVFTFGNMLIGFVMAKSNFFISPNKRFQNLLIISGLTIGLAASYIFYLILNGTLELSMNLIWLPFLLIFISPQLIISPFFFSPGITPQMQFRRTNKWFGLPVFFRN